jgi:hypothetical protein
MTSPSSYPEAASMRAVESSWCDRNTKHATEEIITRVTRNSNIKIYE